jgi:hypothetical protein
VLWETSALQSSTGLPDIFFEVFFLHPTLALKVCQKIFFMEMAAKLLVFVFGWWAPDVNRVHVRSSQAAHFPCTQFILTA